MMSNIGVDGWISKEFKEENNIAIDEFDKDLIEDGVESKERQRGYLFTNSQAQTK